MEYNWELLPQSTDTTDFGEDLFPQIRTILHNRNITSKEKLQTLKKPDFRKTHNPFLMKDMKSAVERLGEAVSKRQKILVYGDYDVDGTTAIALVYSFLRDRQANVDYYVPNRYTEGYGVSKVGIQWAIENSFQLIITLDCGIKANDTIKMANDASIDVIVCDHHNAGDELPPAFAILDPKRPDCNYPFKELSGCGVGFKLLEAYCITYNLPLKSNLYCYRDYVAISIAADIVPIVDENHNLMYYGLKKMEQKPLPSIQTMLINCGLISLSYDENGFEKLIVKNDELTVSSIVFKIAPKINAAGRMNDARDAIRLLLAENEQDALQYLVTINQHNTNRKEKEQIICKEALEIIEKDDDYQNKSTNVLYKADWHKGVVGIAAAKIIESYYKPTIVLCGNGEIISGSARSVEGFDLYSAINSCSDLLTAFGGHTHAAGLSMMKKDLNEFCRRFDSYVAEHILDNQKQPTILIDSEMTLADINSEFYEQVHYLAPFGPQNMDPVFIIKNIPIESHSYMGGDKSHLRLHFKNQSNSICAVGFFMATLWEEKNMHDGDTVDICFTLSKNVFRDTISYQLMLKDFRKSYLL